MNVGKLNFSVYHFLKTDGSNDGIMSYVYNVPKLTSSPKQNPYAKHLDISCFKFGSWVHQFEWAKSTYKSDNILFTY